MRSTGPSEPDLARSTYVDLCRSYLAAALGRRPSTGPSLEAVRREVHGHAVGCCDLGLIDGRTRFSDRFSSWLSANSRVGTPAGWAVAVGVVARRKGRPAATVFRDLCHEFFGGWEAEPDAPRVADVVAPPDYRTSTAELIRAVLRRPGMHYGRLADLTAMFNGHAAAFEQLGVIKHDERFARKFSTWLKRERGANVRRGWVRGIEGLARTSGQSVDATFAECATAFLEDWLAEPPAVPMPGPAP